MPKDKLFLPFFLGLLGVAGIVLLLAITPLGAGASADSIVYLRGAKSLLAGRGFSINGSPITHYAPLYALFLAVAGLVDHDLVQAARVLGAVFFGVNLVLVASSVYFTAGRKLLFAALAVLLFAVSAPLVTLHSMAWSEPLFIALILTSFLLLARYALRPTLSLLIASSLVMGCALLTRYIGLAFLPAALVNVLLSPAGHPAGKRFRACMLWSLLACLPLGVLATINLALTGSAADRSLGYHPVSASSYLAGAAAGIAHFFTPASLLAGLSWAFWGLFTAWLITLLGMLARQRRQATQGRSPAALTAEGCLMFAASYLLFLWAAVSFVDASTPVDARLLAPLFPLLILGAFSAAWAAAQRLQKRWIWGCFLLLAGLSLALKIPETVRTAAEIQTNGSGYTSRVWRNSETVAAVRLLAEDEQIYSNGADIIAFLTDKPSRSLPFKIIPTTREVNPNYDQEVQALCQDITEHRAVVVVFAQVWREYFPSREELQSTCQLPVLQRFADGSVLGKP